MDAMLTPSSTSSSEPTTPSAVSVIRKINPKNLTIDTSLSINGTIIPIASNIPTMLIPPFTGSSTSSCETYDDSTDGEIDVVTDSPTPSKKSRPSVLPVTPLYNHQDLLNAILLSRQLKFDFSSPLQSILPTPVDDDDGNESVTTESLSPNERRRGRPRKPDVTEGEDGKIIAKRMYARQYRENMKNKFDDLRREIDMHIMEKKELQMRLNQLQRLLEECKCMKKSYTPNSNPMNFAVDLCRPQV